jgi:hypothetical protein
VPSNPSSADPERQKGSQAKVGMARNHSLPCFNNYEEQNPYTDMQTDPDLCVCDCNTDLIQPLSALTAQLYYILSQCIQTLSL